MIGLRVVLTALFASLALLMAPAAAQEVTARDRGQIEARVDGLRAVVTSGDFAATLDVTPPALRAALAARFGLSETDLRTAMAEAMAPLMESVTLVSFDIDLDAAAARTTPDGARTYLMIPTTTIMDVAEIGRLRVLSDTLALEEGGDWYLIRVEEEFQRTMLEQVYPEFVGVAFPPGTTELVE